MPRFPLAIVILLYAASGGAHDLWIERAGARHTLAYGHEGSAHAGPERLDYRPEHVKQAICVDSQGAPLEAGVQLDRFPAMLTGDCAASLFLVSTGYWSKTPYGTKNFAKDAAGGAVLDSWLSFESVKRIDRWGAGLAKPLGQGLELVPLGNPLALKPGAKLRVLASLDGKPVAGVTVAYFGKPRGVSDGSGVVNVRLQQAGLQLIQASLDSPLQDGKADRLVRAATLQFELP